MHVLGVWTGEATSVALLAPPGQPALPAFAPWEAYLDLHQKSGRRAFLRVGRQAVSWGDGLLLGSNDWSSTGRSLDAVRSGCQIGDLNLELLAAILAAPGRYIIQVPESPRRARAPSFTPPTSRIT